LRIGFCAEYLNQMGGYNRSSDGCKKCVQFLYENAEDLNKNR
jgi:hypothetical protein